MSHRNGILKFMIKCNKCNIVQSISEFYTRPNGKLNTSRCKTCCSSIDKLRRHLKREHISKTRKAYRDLNRDKLKVIKAEYYKKNSEVIKERVRKRYFNNHEVCRETNNLSVAKWSKNNPDKNCEKTSNYRARKINAMPKWLSKEAVSKIKALYKHCRKVSILTGIRHEVDHIVPLTSDVVCGLHVPWNLQIITKELNLQKSNKLYEDMICSYEKS